MPSVPTPSAHLPRLPLPRAPALEMKQPSPRPVFRRSRCLPVKYALWSTIRVVLNVLPVPGNASFVSPGLCYSCSQRAIPAPRPSPPTSAPSGCHQSLQLGALAAFSLLSIFGHIASFPRRLGRSGPRPSALLVGPVRASRAPRKHKNQTYTPSLDVAGQRLSVEAKRHPPASSCRLIGLLLPYTSARRASSSTASLPTTVSPPSSACHLPSLPRSTPSLPSFSLTPTLADLLPLTGPQPTLYLCRGTFPSTKIPAHTPPLERYLCPKSTQARTNTTN